MWKIKVWLQFKSLEVWSLSCFPEMNMSWSSQNTIIRTYHTISLVSFFFFLGKAVHQRLLGRAEILWSWHNKDLWLTPIRDVCVYKYISLWLFNIEHQLLTKGKYIRSATQKCSAWNFHHAWDSPHFSRSFWICLISKPYNHLLNTGLHRPGVKTELLVVGLLHQPIQNYLPPQVLNFLSQAPQILKSFLEQSRI